MNILLLVGMISFTVVANLFLKTGAVSVTPSPGSFAHLLNLNIVLGLCSFALAACFYILILQRLPLNVAQSFTAMQFVAIIFASRWFLSEPIGPSQWIGIAFIALGVAIVGWSQH